MTIFRLMSIHYVNRTLIAQITQNVLKINVSVKKDLTPRDPFVSISTNVLLKNLFVVKMVCV